MAATLPFRKMVKIRDLGRILSRSSVSLRGLASFIGLAVAAEPAVALALVRYKYLKLVRSRELGQFRGDYSARVVLNNYAMIDSLVG